MGEIRSTLDIIMEKTKGLTMTEEEKKAFHKSELQGKVRGLLQKFMDGLIDAERLKRDLADLGKDKEDMIEDALKKECLARFDPEVDNTPLIDVLEQAAGINRIPIEKTLAECQQDLEGEMKVREKALKDQLKHKGISGSAVVPNLNAAPGWDRYVAKMTEGLKQDLEVLIHQSQGEG